MRNRPSTIDSLIDCIGLLRRQPRTVGELVGLTELGETAVKRYVSALAEEGLITRSGDTAGLAPGRRAIVYTWVERAADDSTHPTTARTATATPSQGSPCHAR